MHVIYNPYWHSGTWYAPPWYTPSVFLPSAIWGSGFRSYYEGTWDRLLFKF
ncbi:MAG: hypothetical protein ACI35O_14995 [Bacillaceae bacterium]